MNFILENTVAVMLSALSSASFLCAAEWHIESTGQPFFRYQTGEAYSPAAGSYVKTHVFNAPARTRSQPSTSMQAATSLRLVPGKPAELQFRYSDSYANAANRGFFMPFITSGKSILWQQDAALPNDRMFNVAIPPHCFASGVLHLAVGIKTLRPVTNFKLSACFEEITVRQGKNNFNLLPVIAPPDNFQEVPDLVVNPVRPPRTPEWMRELIAVQAWFQPDYNLMKRTGEYLPLVRDELKMNVILMRPPAVFTAIHQRKTPPPGHMHTPQKEFIMTDADWFKAADAYRRNGFKIIMYTSITNMGHSASWNNGSMQKAHPEWLQRGPDGEEVFAFGNRNLCPNSGALDAAIAYANSLCRKYKVDALMFDNNFFQAPKNADKTGAASCYCATCRQKFREYMRNNYRDQLSSVFGVTEQNVDIPSAPGPLMNVWIDWRNLVWADALEKMRAAVPVLVFANTEYMWHNWLLGVDRLYRSEDAVFSESNSLRDLPEKYAIGNAFAPDRPHFSYLVPYMVAGERFWQMRRPAEVAELTGTTLLFNVNPWLMFHGWDPKLGYPEPIGDANKPSQDILKRYFQFRHAHREWYRHMKPVGEIAVVAASRNRMYLHERNYSPALSLLLRRNFAVDAIHDLTLASADLAKYRIIIADGYECMSATEANALADFMRNGGIVYASPEAGRRDQFGRRRPNSILFDNKKLSSAKPIIYTDLTQLPDIVAQQMLWQSQCPDTIIRPYQLPDGRILLHGMVQHGKHKARILHLPRALHGTRSATLHSPHLNKSQHIEIRDNSVPIPAEAWYFVLEIPAPRLPGK